MNLPLRNPTSHKGQNGRVLIIGGNEIFHGAPILAALGAEKSGVDLIHLCVPLAQVGAAKTAALNFMVHSFQEAHFTTADLPLIRSLSRKVDVLLIGNGLGREKGSLAALLQLLVEEIGVPVVLDGEALLPEIWEVEHENEWTLTPHGGEFQRLFNVSDTPANVAKMSQKYQCTILKKGVPDVVAGKGGRFLPNQSGVPEMSVGGTGDALAGIVAGFIARGLDPFSACESAAFLWGKCGAELSKTHFSFSAKDLLEIFPQVVKKHQSVFTKK